jgi:methionyl-tRNA formyltransferase
MQWAVLKGYSSTGVSTQFMSKKMDAGDILKQITVSIGPNETSGELQERLRLIGADLLVNTIDEIATGKIKPLAQDHAKATLAPLLNKEMGDLAWAKKSANEIHNLIRGLNPWPGAYTFFQGKRVKILRSQIPAQNLPLGSDAPGTIRIHGDQLFVACNMGWIELLSLLWEGKKPSLPRDFANGMKGQGTLLPRFHTAEG